MSNRWEKLVTVSSFFPTRIHEDCPPVLFFILGDNDDAMSKIHSFNDILCKQLKYKRRVYKMLHLDEKQLRSLHTRVNLRRFFDYVTSGQTEKITKMCAKGLDPNIHCQETGGKFYQFVILSIFFKCHSFTFYTNGVGATNKKRRDDTRCLELRDSIVFFS